MLFVRITQIFMKYNVGIVEFRKLSSFYNYKIKNPLELAMQTSPKGNLHRLTTGFAISICYPLLILHLFTCLYCQVHSNGLFLAIVECDDCLDRYFTFFSGCDRSVWIDSRYRLLARLVGDLCNIIHVQRII